MVLNFSIQTDTDSKLEIEKQRAKNEAMLREKEKQRQDSLTRAQAQEQRAIEEAKLKEKAKQDSLWRVGIQEIALKYNAWGGIDTLDYVLNGIEEYTAVTIISVSSFITSA